MTNAVFLNDGTPGRYQTGELTPIGQGAVGVVIPLLFLNFANRPVNISGYTITANMENVSNGDVTAVDGALAVTSGTAGAATWTVTANDTGTDAAFDVVFTLTKSASPTYVSSPTRLLVSDNPSVTASATNLLVGILQSLKDWLTAEKAAIEAADDGEILQSDGTNSEGTNYLTATSLRKHNFTAVVAPTVNDDTGDGYEAGSYWVDTVGGAIYFCQAATLGAAVWIDASAGAGSTDGGRMDWVIHVPGTLAANVNARWTIPVDCRILHISAVTSNNSDATVAFGISTDTDSILVPSAIGDSNTPVVFNSGDWAGTNPTADMTTGQIAVLTVDYDGASGTAGNDLTVIVTTTGNAVGDLADISDLAAAGFSANDYTKWNGSIFVNVTPAGVLSDIGAGTGDGDLLAANNLSELTATAATVRTNLAVPGLATSNSFTGLNVLNAGLQVIGLNDPVGRFISGDGNRRPLLIGGATSQAAHLFEVRATLTGTLYFALSENGYMKIRKAAAPADAELDNGDMAIWFDQTTPALAIKAKKDDGTILTGSVTLS